MEEITQTNVMLLPSKSPATRLKHFANKCGIFLQQKFWLVLLGALTGFVAAFVILSLQTPLYVAQTPFILTPPPLTPQQNFIGIPHLEVSLSHGLALFSSPELIRTLSEHAEIRAILAVEQALDTSATGAQTPQDVADRLRAAIQIIPSGKDYSLTVSDPNPRIAEAVARLMPLLYESIGTSESTPDTLPFFISLHRRHLRAERERPHMPATTAADTAPPPQPVHKLSPSQSVTLPILIPGAPTFAKHLPAGNASLLKKEIALLEVALRNPANAPSAAFAGTNLQAIHRRIASAKGQLQNMITRYQVPQQEQEKIKNRIATDSLRLIQSIKYRLANKRQQLAALTNAPATVPTLAQPTVTLQVATRPEKSATPTLTLMTASAPQAMPDLSQINHKLNLLNIPADDKIPPAILTVLQLPTLPERPNQPFKTLWIAGSALGGLLLGAFAATLIGFKDERITAPEDIEEEFDLPVLGLFPALKESLA